MSSHGVPPLGTGDSTIALQERIMALLTTLSATMATKDDLAGITDDLATIKATMATKVELADVKATMATKAELADLRADVGRTYEVGVRGEAAHIHGWVYAAGFTIVDVHTLVEAAALRDEPLHPLEPSTSSAERALRVAEYINACTFRDFADAVKAVDDALVSATGERKQFLSGIAARAHSVLSKWVELRDAVEREKVCREESIKAQGELRDFVVARFGADAAELRNVLACMHCALPSDSDLDAAISFAHSNLLKWLIDTRGVAVMALTSHVSRGQDSNVPSFQHELVIERRSKYYDAPTNMSSIVIEIARSSWSQMQNGPRSDWYLRRWCSRSPGHLRLV